MGSIGASKSNNLPKYSNEQGVILNSTVEADPRYTKMAAVEGLMSYQAREILRDIMRIEEKGETEGEITVYDFQTSGTQTFGNLLTAHTRAIKEAGYKVYERVNEDIRSGGYHGGRGRYNYDRTDRARTLKFRKV